jgi:hypothetical protein
MDADLREKVKLVAIQAVEIYITYSMANEESGTVCLLA